jgi:xylulose-5-phosphate/fructose-6-phosphate phosphoketolase
MAKATSPSDATSRPAPLSATELEAIDAYWRASNYLSVGQIYLYDNPLLKQPLTKEHVKPRLLGHWGTTPASTSSTCISIASSRSTTST